MKRYRPVILLLFLCVCGRGVKEPWIELLAGPDFSAWQEDTGDWLLAGSAFVSPEDAKLLVTEPGEGVAVNGATGRTGHLFSVLEHGDCELYVEFMVPEGSNSGVYLMGRYEVQVFDSWGKENPAHSDCGGLYQRWRDGKGFEGVAPRVNASRPPGEWQSFEIEFRAPRFDDNGEKISDAVFDLVKHNGQVIHENVTRSGPTRAAAFSDEQPLGPLMLQGDHGPVAYRDIRIRPLK
jgi:hypothetical protein